MAKSTHTHTHDISPESSLDLSSHREDSPGAASFSTIPDSQESEIDDFEEIYLLDDDDDDDDDEADAGHAKNSNSYQHLSTEHITLLDQILDESPFWKSLAEHPPLVTSTSTSYTSTDGGPVTVSLKSRDWAKYVYEAGRIYLLDGMGVDEIVSILDETVRYVAIDALKADCVGGIIYFEDGCNVFYDPDCRGIPECLKVKYEAVLGVLRDNLVQRGEIEQEHEDRHEE